MKPITSVVLVATFTVYCVCTACGGSGGSTVDTGRVSICVDVPYPAQENSAYVLPWQVGETYLVGQGNCVAQGSGSHAQGTRAEYAYDIVMPIGTALLAVRDGTVIYVEEGFPDGTRVPGEENTIVIEHDDGTLSNYGHLTTMGAIVTVGEDVRQSAVIGMSGDSGASTEPHLHFEILACDGEPIIFEPTVSFSPSCRSLPTTFQNTQAHPQGLIEGETYEALTPRE